MGHKMFWDSNLISIVDVECPDSIVPGDTLKFYRQARGSNA